MILATLTAIAQALGIAVLVLMAIVLALVLWRLSRSPAQLAAESYDKALWTKEPEDQKTS